MSRKEKSYSAELKYQAVSDYLSGKGLLREICRKYKIRSTRQLRNWIKMYNGHKELKCYTGGSRMTKGRKTTYEERIAFVKECMLLLSGSKITSDIFKTMFCPSNKPENG